MGLLSIAASLKAHGYSVEIIDPQIDDDYQRRLHEALALPLLFVGMSSYLGENIDHAIELSRFIKTTRPNLPIVLGGPLASSIPDVFFDHIPVDYIVMGSGELTVIKLSEALKKMEDPGLIPNISYTKNGRFILGKNFVYDGCLDDLPPPSLDEWERGIEIMGSIPIISSRGCHRGCAFCYNTFTGRRKFYLRSPESVITEMEHWSNRFNIRSFQFYDDNFLINPKRATAILDEMAQRHWEVLRLFGHLNEFDNVPPEQLRDTVKCIVMCIESASSKIQSLLNKRLDIEKAFAVIKRINAQNIRFITAFMFGLPTETDDDIRLSIECAARIREMDETNTSMCYIYAPQPKDAIVRGINSSQPIDFSLEALSNVEVVPVPPDNKIDLRLRPWMDADNQAFYLDFTQVWQYHFAHYDDPSFNLSDIYSRNKRVERLFRNVSPPAPASHDADVPPTISSQDSSNIKKIHVIKLKAQQAINFFKNREKY